MVLSQHRNYYQGDRHNHNSSKEVLCGFEMGLRAAPLPAKQTHAADFAGQVRQQRGEETFFPPE